MYLARTGKLKRQKIPNIGEDVGQLEISHMARERKCHHRSGSLVRARLVKGNPQIIFDPRTHAPGTRSPEMHISTHKRYVRNAYGGVICKRQNRQGTQLSINRGVKRP